MAALKKRPLAPHPAPPAERRDSRTTAEIAVMKVFSSRLVAAREAKMIPKWVLSRNLIIPPDLLEEFENGDRLPTLITAIRMADELSVSLDHLMGLKDA